MPLLRRLLACLLFIASAPGAAPPNPSLEAARAILRVPANRSSWAYIAAHSGKRDHAFIWTQDGLEVEQWNAKAAATAGLPPVQRSVRDGAVFLAYKGAELKVPEDGAHDDTLAVHTLDQLVRQDSPVFWCLDSWNSSDPAFLSLPPAQWRQLVREFGKEAVEYRFSGFANEPKWFLYMLDNDENHRYFLGDPFARQDLFIVDPHPDARSFAAYVAGVRPEVTVRLLVQYATPELEAAVHRYARRHKARVELKRNPSITQRLVIFDGGDAWDVGDAPGEDKTPPAYITPRSDRRAGPLRNRMERYWAPPVQRKKGSPAAAPES
jgi:hypothetical protein